MYVGGVVVINVDGYATGFADCAKRRADDNSTGQTVVLSRVIVRLLKPAPFSKLWACSDHKHAAEYRVHREVAH